MKYHCNACSHINGVYVISVNQWIERSWMSIGRIERRPWRPTPWLWSSGRNLNGRWPWWILNTESMGSLRGRNGRSILWNSWRWRGNCRRRSTCANNGYGLRGAWVWLEIRMTCCELRKWCRWHASQCLDQKSWQRNKKIIKIYTEANKK